jgi:hypothetical protein
MALCPRSRALELPALLGLWHLSSLDAPTVAVTWSFAFAWMMGVALPRAVPLLLALIAWAIYVSDRLLDARAAFGASNVAGLRERHFFHWRHRRVLLPGAVAAAALALVIILACLTPGVRDRDSVLGLATLAYFSGVHLPHRHRKRLSSLVTKEFLVGLLFTAGCVLPTVSRLRETPAFPATLLPLVLPGLVFAALAWLNCAAIDCWESGTRRGIAAPACLVGIGGLSLALLLGASQPRAAALLVAAGASAALLALLDRVRFRLTPLAMRTAADLVLLTPVFLLTVR